MKTINTITLTSLPVSAGYSGTERTADDEARLHRDAERAKQRRLQNNVRHHAEAENRLADALVRASARTAQLARTARSSPENPVLPSVAHVNDPATAADAADTACTAGKQARETAEMSACAADQLEDWTNLSDPVASVLQRIAGGQSRGLLQDCAPMLEALAAQMTHGTLKATGPGSDAAESLACALEFLQGYADATLATGTSADRMVKLLMEVRQQFHSLVLDASSSNPTVVVAGQQSAMSNPTNAQIPRTGKDQGRIHATRKVRHGSDGEGEDGLETLEVESGMAVAASVAGAQTKGASVSESSLDKDQHKRRDDTLPLVTLRSI